MKDFGVLGARNAAFRKKLIDLQPSVCTDRAMLTTAAYQAHE